MSLLSLKNISFSVGQQVLLNQIELDIQSGERVCLIGRNGEGKSTLLRVIAGLQMPDDGQVQLQSGKRLAYVAQEPKLDTGGTVFETVAKGLGQLGTLISEYHAATLQLANCSDDKALQNLEKLQHELESQDGWLFEQKVEQVISLLQLPPDALLETLSGGWKRRVALAQALVQNPDLLMLDEPTNHLDIEAINWLENFLRDYNGALLFITHDRTFLKKMAKRILELDRGQLTSWPGDYDNYLRRREERENEEAKLNAEFDKKLAQEETWIRQGIKARRTRNEGRVRALKAMREKFSQRVSRQGKANMQLASSNTSGKIVVDAEHIQHHWDGKPLIGDFSTRIFRGDHIGLIGPNGCGKSTLLKLLLGQLTPSNGKIKLGTNLDVAYFDQYREQLDEEKSAIDNVSDQSDHITVNGKPRHVISYLRDFLFSPERARTPVKVLSGGERNRLLLARLFAKPANLLVLDEPTNDLDIETLEILEDLLLNYTGTLLLVSHDREFLNNVVSSVIAFEGNAVVRQYVGGYDDWIRQRPKPVAAEKKSASKTGAATKPKAQKNSRKKLSYKDQRELETLPQCIDALENEQTQLQQTVSEPGFYNGNQNAVSATLKRMEEIDIELTEAYARWETLEAMLSD